MMVHLREPVRSKPDCLIRPLRLVRHAPGTAIRYEDDCFQRAVFGTVYLPEVFFDRGIPGLCYLEVHFVDDPDTLELLDLAA
ncbi:MAG: hypothetical protein LC118_00755 [Dehalococcoidia bacterium]|nr:hypothetical protein [Dehalococcoidia bacterium]